MCRQNVCYITQSQETGAKKLKQGVLFYRFLSVCDLNLKVGNNCECFLKWSSREPLLNLTSLVWISIKSSTQINCFKWAWKAWYKIVHGPRQFRWLLTIDAEYNCGSIFGSIPSFHLPSSAFPQYLLLNGPIQRTLKEITNCETYFDNKPQTMNTHSSKIQKGYLCGGLK